MDDNDAKHVLLTVRRMMLTDYPYPATVDLRYAMAFALIAGIATEAIQAVQQGRPINIETCLVPKK